MRKTQHKEKQAALLLRSLGMRKRAKKVRCDCKEFGVGSCILHA